MAWSPKYSRTVLTDPTRYPPERLLRHARWWLDQPSPASDRQHAAARNEAMAAWRVAYALPLCASGARCWAALGVVARPVPHLGDWRI